MGGTSGGCVLAASLGLKGGVPLENFLQVRSGWRAARPLTFLAQQEGEEAQVVDTQVEPALAGHSALPIATRVVVDQLLSFRHPELLPHLQLGLLELAGVFVSLGLQVLVLFCNDALGRMGLGGSVPGRWGPTALWTWLLLGLSAVTAWAP